MRPGHKSYKEGKARESKGEFGFTFDGATVFDKFGNFWQLDDWVAGNVEPFETRDEAYNSMFNVLSYSGVDNGLVEEGVDLPAYVDEFTDFAIESCPGKYVKE